ncbi:hypothetical protein EON81_14975 [bacterium]|nr:MAG: hypothetical protein EON81_14975 [bacterium]
MTDSKHDELVMNAYELWNELDGEPMVYGAVLGIVKVVACYRTEDLGYLFEVTDLQRALGNYAPGRYAWVCEVVERFNPPIPAKGMQGIWKWNPPVGDR